MPPDNKLPTEIPFQPSTIETVDQALFDFVDKGLNIFSTTNKGWKKSPVIWVAGERAYQIKRDKGLRDLNGTLILPLITVERTGMVKDKTRKGAIYAHLPPVNDAKGGVSQITYSRRIQQDKTNNFLSADSKRSYAKQLNFPDIKYKPGPYQAFKNPDRKKIVYETVTMPLPIWLDMTYSIVLRAEYQQQINEMVVPFVTSIGNINYVTIYNTQANHRYEAFIQQDFTQTNNVSSMEQDERMYETKIDIKVLGYVQGSDKNDEQPKIVIRENQVEFKLQRERVVFGDEVERVTKRPNLDIDAEPGTYRP